VAEGVEDDASMAPLSVRRTHELVSLVHRTVAYELITAAQAIDIRGCRPLGRGTSVAYEAVREHVPMLRDVRSWDPDIEGLVDAISRGELGSRIAAETGVSAVKVPIVSIAASLKDPAR
jgi:histidine ammonia-lyase